MVRCSFTLTCFFAIPIFFFVIPSFTIASSAAAQTFTTIASFDNTNGASPSSPLVQGVDGNFYGTTYYGGASLAGVIYKVTPSGILTTFYNFCSQKSCTDGANPVSALVLGPDGNFYGTTPFGGAECPIPLTFGCGTVFTITSSGQLTTLYAFCLGQKSCIDGAVPSAPLLLASDGNFYGTTSEGGQYDSGTVFRMTPAGTLTTLYSFCARSGCPDGAYPRAALLESGGLFYGTTSSYGAKGSSAGGTIFSITSAGNLTTLHKFVSGGMLAVPLTLASNGTLDGASEYGGDKKYCADGCGTVFSITSSTGSFATLHRFCTTTDSCPDGRYPYTTLIQATDGNLYGTTTIGGYDDSGTIFRVTPSGAFATVYQLNYEDGGTSEGGMIQATDGNFYGTTLSGGTSLVGTVFRFSLGLPPSAQAVPKGSRVGGRVLMLGNDRF